MSHSFSLTLVEGTVSNGRYAIPKDANDALRAGADMEALIGEASVLPHHIILLFEDLRDQVRHKIFHPDKYTGFRALSLPMYLPLDQRG